MAWVLQSGVTHKRRNPDGEIHERDSQELPGVSREAPRGSQGPQGRSGDSQGESQGSPGVLPGAPRGPKGPPIKNKRQDKESKGGVPQ